MGISSSYSNSSSSGFTMPVIACFTTVTSVPGASSTIAWRSPRCLIVPWIPEVSSTREPTSRLALNSFCAATCLRIGRISMK